MHNDKNKIRVHLVDVNSNKLITVRYMHFAPREILCDHDWEYIDTRDHNLIAERQGYWQCTYPECQKIRTLAEIDNILARDNLPKT